MSIDDDFADLYADTFDTFGIDASVQRGFATPVPVRVIVRYGIEKHGEYGQVIALVTTVDFMVPQWSPEQGDKLTWKDLQGVTKTRAIANEITNNGHVAKAVLHGG